MTDVVEGTDVRQTPSETPYRIRVNNQEVWRSVQDSRQIVELQILTPRGEATTVRVPRDEAVMDIVVMVRDDASSTYLDIEEAKARDLREAALLESERALRDDIGQDAVSTIGRNALEIVGGAEDEGRLYENVGPSAREARVNPDINPPKMVNTTTGLAIPNEDLPGEEDPMRKEARPGEGGTTSPGGIHTHDDEHPAPEPAPGDNENREGGGANDDLKLS